MSQTPKTAGNSRTSGEQLYYLLAYNLISAALWLRILLGVVKTVVLAGYHHETTSICEQTYEKVEPWTRWTQTLALIEIIHAAFGKLLLHSITLPVR